VIVLFKGTSDQSWQTAGQNKIEKMEEIEKSKIINQIEGPTIEKKKQKNKNDLAPIVNETISLAVVDRLCSTTS